MLYAYYLIYPSQQLYKVVSKPILQWTKLNREDFIENRYKRGEIELSLKSTLLKQMIWECIKH